MNFTVNWISPRRDFVYGFNFTLHFQDSKLFRRYPSKIRNFVYA